MRINSTGPISGPVNLTDRQELILQMFAEDKSLSIGKLCEKTRLPSTTAKREIAFHTNPLITAQVLLRPKFKKWDIFGDTK